MISVRCQPDMVRPLGLDLVSGIAILTQHLTKVKCQYRKEVRKIMPEQWTGELIGEIHNAGFKIKEVAAEAKINPKYVSQVLHGKAVSPNVESKMKEALERMKARKLPESRGEEPK